MSGAAANFADSNLLACHDVHCGSFWQVECWRVGSMTASMFALCESLAEMQDGQALFDALSFCCTYP